MAMGKKKGMGIAIGFLVTPKMLPLAIFAASSATATAAATITTARTEHK